MHYFNELDILEAVDPNSARDESAPPIVEISGQGSDNIDFHEALSGRKCYINYQNNTLGKFSKKIVLCAEILKWRLTSHELSLFHALLNYKWEIIVFQGETVPLVDLKPVTSTFELYQQIEQMMESASHRNQYL